MTAGKTVLAVANASLGWCHVVAARTQPVYGGSFGEEVSERSGARHAVNPALKTRKGNGIDHPAASVEGFDLSADAANWRVKKMDINWRKQIIDQSGHVLAGGVIGFLISLASGGCIPCGASIAALVGLVREIVQHDGHIRGRGSFTDIAFWTIGGAIGAFFAS